MSNAITPTPIPLVFLKAADLLAGPWRDTLNAATMLGQSKTVFQAEIDAACELIDFWRFNVALHAPALRGAADLLTGMWNRVEYRAARGVRLRGDAVQLHLDRRQPADGAGADGQHRAVEAGVDRGALGYYWIMRLLEEAGLPPG
jgi:1-pyrroline-5-carboxylate dehydrogenase